MDKKVDKAARFVKGLVRSQQQEARRQIVKQRLDNNARDERKQFIVAPRFDLLQDGHR